MKKDIIIVTNTPNYFSHITKHHNVKFITLSDTRIDDYITGKLKFTKEYIIIYALTPSFINLKLFMFATLLMGRFKQQFILFFKRKEVIGDIELSISMEQFKDVRVLLEMAEGQNVPIICNDITYLNEYINLNDFNISSAVLGFSSETVAALTKFTTDNCGEYPTDFDVITKTLMFLNERGFIK